MGFADAAIEILNLEHSDIKPRPNESNISTQHIPTLLAHNLQAPVIATFQRNKSQHCRAQHVARV